MPHAKPVVQIVVAQPPSDPLGGGDDTARSLARLGYDAGIDIVHDVDTCVRLVREGDVDLVVIDQAIGESCDRLLSSLRGSGPPV